MCAVLLLYSYLLMPETHLVNLYCPSSALCALAQSDSNWGFCVPIVKGLTHSFVPRLTHHVTQGTIPVWLAGSSPNLSNYKT